MARDAAGNQGEPSLERLRERALKLLAVRDRSRAEMARRLRREGASEAAISDVLAWLERLGYLDEERFAENWIRARQSRYGPLRLEAELREKGLEPGYVRELVARSAADEEALEATARDLVERRLRRGAGAARPGEDARERRRLMGFLVRRGFPESIAARAVERALDGMGDGEVEEPPAFR